MQFTNRFSRYSFLFMVGGFLYGIIEMLYKNGTHISMIIAGGTAFVLIGELNEGDKSPSLLGQMVVSAVIVTAIEFVTGLIVNVWLGLNVWDYSSLPYNFMGQICLLFSVLWFGLSIFAIVLDDVIRHFLFGNKKRHYHLL